MDAGQTDSPGEISKAVFIRQLHYSSFTVQIIVGIVHNVCTVWLIVEICLIIIFILTSEHGGLRRKSHRVTYSGVSSL